MGKEANNKLSEATHSKDFKSKLTVAQGFIGSSSKTKE